MQNKPKILIVTPLYPPEIGGPATHVSLIEDELSEIFELEIIKFAEVSHLPYIIRHIALFLKIFKKGGWADKVYALDPLGVGLPSAFVAKMFNKPFVLRVVGDRAWETLASKKGEKTESLDTYSKKRWPLSPIIFLKFGQWLTASLANTIIVPSEYLKKIVSNWGVNSDKIKIVKNSFEPINITESKEDLRIKLGLKGKIVLSAGRLEKWKGFSTLNEVVSSIQDAHLLVAGDGSQKEELERMSVKLLGRLPKIELLEYIKAADVFVLNTFYEGLSHQLLEVMSIGTPIVTTKVGGNPELIKDGKNGLLVPYNDKEELKEAIEKLLNDPTYANGLAQQAKVKSKEFSKEKMLSELKEILV